MSAGRPNPDEFDSREVYVAGELEGYALYHRQDRKPITPVRCCRTCAWADIDGVRYVPGIGYRYFPVSPQQLRMRQIRAVPGGPRPVDPDDRAGGPAGPHVTIA